MEQLRQEEETLLIGHHLLTTSKKLMIQMEVLQTLVLKVWILPMFQRMYMMIWLQKLQHPNLSTG